MDLKEERGEGAEFGHSSLNLTVPHHHPTSPSPILTRATINCLKFPPDLSIPYHHHPVILSPRPYLHHTIPSSTFNTSTRTIPSPIISSPPVTTHHQFQNYHYPKTTSSLSSIRTIQIQIPKSPPATQHQSPELLSSSSI